MNRKKDIIFFTLSRWDSPISSPSLALAKEFSKKNRVFYIDHPYSYKDYLKFRKTEEIKSRKSALLHGRSRYKKVEGEGYSFTAITTNLTYPINFLPKGILYNYLSSLNDKIVFDTIREVIKDFDIKDFVFINAYDPFFIINFPEDIKPFLKVYQSMDDITQEEYTAKHGKRLEEEIVKNYDITLTTSKELKRLKSKHSDFVYYHPNASDFTLFEKAVGSKLEKPTELQEVDVPVIGYTGQIGSRIDFELLKKIADQNPDKIIYMVGPVGDDEYKIYNLHKIKNVKFAGAKKIDELPNHLQYMDCTIIPFKKNTLTKSIYPLKINEYLSAGKAVITTNFSEDIASFNDCVYLSDTHEAFINNIDKAISENSPIKIKQRIEKAKENTWEARVESFWSIVEDYVEKNNLW